jgi:hypothetical protein
MTISPIDDSQRTAASVAGFTYLITFSNRGLGPTVTNPRE